VWIAEMFNDEFDPKGWITVNYCSPFAGVTNWETTSQSTHDTFTDTQMAYGMWAVPPDINNEVIVMFLNGSAEAGIWMGCLYKEYTQHEVPAMATSPKNKQTRKHSVPVTAYNKWDTTDEGGKNPLNPTRPWHETRTKGIGEQGLIDDHVRGLTSSSAMRESPSTVFGISTPGPIDPKRSKYEHGIGRLGGNSFVMDDGDENGDDEYIGFRTRSGASFRIDETNGIIYAINKKGTAWIQMDEDGNVDIFGAKSISMRSQEDFNIRADGDVNIEAGQNVNIKAAKDTDSTKKVIKPGSGEGGDINFHAENDLNGIVKRDAYITVFDGNLDIGVKVGNKTEHIGGNVDFRSDGNVKETVQGSHGIEASNYSLSDAGSIEMNQEIIAGTIVYAGQDVRTPSHSLNDHQHSYEKPQHGAGMMPTVRLGGGGGGSNASGPTASKPTEAKFIKTSELTNVLSTFNGTTPITLMGNPAFQLTNYWDRNQRDMETIVKRLMTYEPCPAHKNKG